MNKILLIGNLTRDTEESALKDGTSVAEFAIAVNRYGGEVDYFNCVCYGKLADNVNLYTKKGSKVAVTGRMELKVVEYEDGSKRTYPKVVASEVDFLSTKKEDEAEAEPPKKAVQQRIKR